MPEPLPDHVTRYLDGLVPARAGELQAMERYGELIDFPIIGPASGNLCYLLARAVGARRVFELGSGYGYSTAWFARAVQENGGGEVYHAVWHADLSQQAKGHLARLGFGDIVRFQVGEAVQTLRETPGPFDIIFNDIDKNGYPAALPVIAAKLRVGGLLITDNMLWHGRVFDAGDHSATTEGVREFTRLVMTDPGWIASVVPIRDGVLVAYKRQ